jgi:hypothetical protein
MIGSSKLVTTEEDVEIPLVWWTYTFRSLDTLLSFIQEFIAKWLGWIRDAGG